MKNTGCDVALGYRAWAVNDLKIKMTNSEYSDDLIDNIIDVGLTGYYNKVEQELLGNE